MSSPLILLHEEALRMDHPVFSVAPAETRAVFIWDDQHFKEVNYSVKRLVFIYETLCEMPLEIIRGETTTVIKELAPTLLYVPSSNNPIIISMIRELKSVTKVEIVEDCPFVKIKKRTDCRRFFQYWNKAEKTAFQKNGGE